MEIKTPTVDELRASAYGGLERQRESFISQRGINSKTPGADTRLVHGKAVSIQKYRLDKLFSRLYKNVDCICVAGSVGSHGYTSLFTGKNILSHRFSYEFFVGAIPKGLVIDHLCNNRVCIEPTHLIVTTHQENILRGNGATAINARKPNCPKGHEYTPHGKRRYCRSCYINYMREYHQKRKMVEEIYPRATLKK